MIRRALSSQVSSIGPRQVRVICSTGEVDRCGEVVVQTGIKLANYGANPVVLWSHDPTQPIGRCSQIGLNSARNLQADIEFAPPGISIEADKICGLVKAGYIKTVSIGFDPLKTEPMDKTKTCGPQRYLESDLMELSFVSIPANVGANVIERTGARRLREGRVISAETDAALADIHTSVTKSMRHAKSAQASLEALRGLGDVGLIDFGAGVEDIPEMPNAQNSKAARMRKAAAFRLAAPQYASAGAMASYLDELLTVAGVKEKPVSGMTREERIAYANRLRR